MTGWAGERARRLWGIVAAVAVLAAAAAGCGEDESTAGADKTTTTRPSATTTEAITTTSTSSVASASTPADEGPRRAAGAPSPLMAATIVLTEEGTPEQACDRFVTDSFVEAAYGGSENCLASRQGEGLAREIVRLPGPERQSLRFAVKPSGGPYDGVRVEVEVVESPDGGYLLDALEARVPAGP